MARLIVFRQDRPVALALEELVLVSETTTAEEWRDAMASFRVKSTRETAGENCGLRYGT